MIHFLNSRFSKKTNKSWLIQTVSSLKVRHGGVPGQKSISPLTVFWVGPVNDVAHFEQAEPWGPVSIHSIFLLDQTWANLYWTSFFSFLSPFISLGLRLRPSRPSLHSNLKRKIIILLEVSSILGIWGCVQPTAVCNYSVFNFPKAISQLFSVLLDKTFDVLSVSASFSAIPTCVFNDIDFSPFPCKSALCTNVDKYRTGPHMILRNFSYEFVYKTRESSIWTCLQVNASIRGTILQSSPHSWRIKENDVVVHVLVSGPFRLIGVEISNRIPLNPPPCQLRTPFCRMAWHSLARAFIVSHVIEMPRRESAGRWEERSCDRSRVATR